ncbi:threonine ammonia-lyase IlvA [Pseudofulvibacter geojedonensis]|uniref:L-threonine dehydratase n=1 Tax=Pseudofulvibacter geojedonensis TaxID=1123758 RepID=A0ABW3I4S6_9FLAO
MKLKTVYRPTLSDVEKAVAVIKEVVTPTPLQLNITASNKVGAQVYLKREDLQLVRSYKIRGAYNKISSLTNNERANGVVCASAGNHAQGVAFSCKKLQIKGTIFMPVPTPNQKVEQVRLFGGEFCDIKLVGDTFDDAYLAAKEFEKENELSFIHPFDDEKVIEGQATIGLELLEQTNETIDYVFVPVGGGGLASGVCSVFKQLSPTTKIIGVEPGGAPSMSTSIKNNKNTTLSSVDKFVDGAAVKRVGELTYSICKELLDDMITVPEGKVCQTILELYSKDAIVVEPAGALTLAVLDFYKEEIKGKNIVCLVSGSNNDISRTAEIKERALLYENLKHYFLVSFPQRAGALKEFVTEVLGPNDDITHFEYSKKHHREQGPAVVGIQLKEPKDFNLLLERMKKKSFYGEYLNNKPDLFQFLV